MHFIENKSGNLLFYKQCNSKVYQPNVVEIQEFSTGFSAQDEQTPRVRVLRQHLQEVRLQFLQGNPPLLLRNHNNRSP